MQPEQSNLLTSLRRWADRQVENFTTDAFAHLLSYLRLHQPKVAAVIFRDLTDNRLEISDEECSKTLIATQVRMSEGTPDIKITFPGRVVLVEVKVDSSPCAEQLASYAAYLRSLRVGTHLVLLTRYAVTVDRPEISRNFVRWYQLAESLRKQVSQSRDPIATYLLTEFTDFLRERGMTMERVSWQMVEGIKSMVSLVDMLEEALVSAKGDIAKHQGWNDGCGHVFSLNGKQGRMAVRFSRPGSVEFAARNVDKILAQKIPHGELKTWDGDKFRWRCRLDLESEDVHFFARNRDSQMECLEAFLARCIQNIEESWRSI